MPERRESASPPAPAPAPATLLPVYVMLPLDTVWPVERDGKSVRAQVFAHVCGPAPRVRRRRVCRTSGALRVYALRCVCLLVAPPAGERSPTTAGRHCVCALLAQPPTSIAVPLQGSTPRPGFRRSARPGAHRSAS